jgi:hypothetical protein
MGRKARKKRAQDHNGAHTPDSRVRQWAPVIIGAVSLIVAVFAARTGYRSFIESRKTVAVERKLEIDQAVFHAWDLIGGQPGSLEITDFKRDKESLELARRQIEKALTLDPANASALLAKAAYLRVSGAPEDSIEVPK